MHGSWLAVGGQDALVHVFDGETFALVHLCKGHTSAVAQLDWSADCKFLQSCSVDYDVICCSSRCHCAMSSAAGRGQRRMAPRGWRGHDAQH